MDAAEEWDQARRRVTELARDADPDRTVPACPDWTVRALVAHMVGLDADVLAGDEPDDHNSEWTQRQVDERSDRDLAAIVSEWDGLAGDMQAYLRDTSPRPLGDVIIHEQDLRGAVGRSGGRDSAGLAAIRDQMAERLAAKVSDAALPPVKLVGDDGWSFATGDAAPGLVLEAPTFDLARSLMSRRSANQLSGWVTSGDLEEYGKVFEILGPLPEDDLAD